MEATELPARVSKPRDTPPNAGYKSLTARVAHRLDCVHHQRVTRDRNIRAQHQSATSECNIRVQQGGSRKGFEPRLLFQVLKCWKFTFPAPATISVRGASWVFVRGLVLVFLPPRFPYMHSSLSPSGRWALHFWRLFLRTALSCHRDKLHRDKRRRDKPLPLLPRASRLNHWAIHSVALAARNSTFSMFMALGRTARATMIHGFCGEGSASF